MYKVEPCFQIENLKQTYKDNTFSGYKKTKVVSALKNCIKKKQFDRACFWMCELNISGFTEKIWDSLVLFSCTEINKENPKLPYYLLNRTKKLYQIIKRYQNPRELCNDIECRNLLCEFIGIITLSPKSKFTDTIKIKDTHFNPQFIETNTPQTHKFSNMFNLDKNASYLELALNQYGTYLIKNFKGTDSTEHCFFWIDWLMFYEKKIKKEYKQEKQWNLKVSINGKSVNDCFLLFWNVLIYILETKKSHKDYFILKENIECLFNLYKLNYKKSSRNKKILFLKLSILLFLNCDQFSNYNIPYCFDEMIVLKACLNINQLYENIIQNSANYQQYKTQIKDKQIEYQNKIRKSVENQSILKKVDNIKKITIKQKKEQEFVNYLNKHNFGKQKINKQIETRKQDMYTLKKRKQYIKNNQVNKEELYKSFLHNLNQTNKTNKTNTKYQQNLDHLTNMELQYKIKNLNNNKRNIKRHYKLLKK